MEKVLNFVVDNWGSISSIVGGSLLLLARLYPTEKNWDVIGGILKALDKAVPNLKRNKDDGSITRHCVIVLLFLMPIFGYSQNNTSTKAIFSLNSDSATVKTMMANVQTLYATATQTVGGLYYNIKSNKWRVYQDSTWSDLVRAAGTTYTFSNGLTNTAGTVKLGGAFTGNTTVGTFGTQGLFFDTNGSFSSPQDSYLFSGNPASNHGYVRTTTVSAQLDALNAGVSSLLSATTASGIPRLLASGSSGYAAIFSEGSNYFLTSPGSRVVQFSNGTNTATFGQAGSIIGNTTFLLPNTNGSSGNVLQTSGTGQTSWVAPSSGTVSSVSITAGTNITQSGSPITGSGSITVNAVPSGSANDVQINVGGSFAGTSGDFTWVANQVNHGGADGIFLNTATGSNPQIFSGSGVTSFSIGSTSGTLGLTGTSGMALGATTGSISLSGTTGTIINSGGNNQDILIISDESSNRTFEVDESGGVRRIGMYGVTPTAQSATGATLTNNITSGGTANQVDNFTSLTVYATDAATIRNDLYQLAEKCRKLEAALKLLGVCID